MSEFEPTVPVGLVAQLCEAGVFAEDGTLHEDPGKVVVTLSPGQAQRFLLYLKRQPEKTSPAARSLEWHKGRHGWQEHDSYPRHQHSLNGVLTIAPGDTQAHFAHGPEFKSTS